MSYSGGDITVSSIGADAGIQNLNVASIPENVRDGDQTAKQAYVQGLAFEQVLVSELTQQLSSSLSGETGVDGSSSGYGDTYGSGSSSSSSSGSYSGSSTSGFSSLIPQALTAGIMDNGGLGIADQIAQSIDPSLMTSSTAATTDATTTGATTDATTTGATTDATPATTGATTVDSASTTSQTGTQS